MDDGCHRLTFLGRFSRISTHMLCFEERTSFHRIQLYGKAMVNVLEGEVIFRIVEGGGGE